jgi:hypothetical protein
LDPEEPIRLARRLRVKLLPTLGDAVDHNESNPVEHLPELANNLRAEDLYDLETYFLNKGRSEFLYDEELDVFRFAEDGCFAFCKEFADWKLLEKRGYLDF